MLTEQPDGSLQCTAQPESGEPPAAAVFTFTDISGTLEMSSSGPENDISLSDTIYDGIFRKLVTDNIFFAFNDGQFAATVFFAIFFGCALAKHLSGTGMKAESSSLFMLLKVCPRRASFVTQNGLTFSVHLVKTLELCVYEIAACRTLKALW